MKSFCQFNSLANTKIENTWAVNNSMTHKPMTTKNATQSVVEILGVNYDKALQAVADTTGPHLSLQDKNKLLECSRKLRSCSMEHQVIGKQSLSPLS